MITTGLADAAMMPETEVAKIERELDMLRARYGIMQRGAALTRRAVFAGTAVVAAFCLYALVIGDVLAIAMSLVSLAVIAILAIAGRGRLRWIDIASPPLYPYWSPQARSEARVIEDMIAEREQRLRELGHKS